MITAVDTNVLVGLWDRDDALNSTAQAALDAAFARGKLVISGAVFAELLALPRRTEAFIEEFLRDTGIGVDWIPTRQCGGWRGKLFRLTQIVVANRGRVNLGDCWPTS
jgi:predicted nucleic acid-binding protein